MVRGHCTELFTVNIHYLNSLSQFPQTPAHADESTCAMLPKSVLSQDHSLRQNPQIMKKFVLFPIHCLIQEPVL